MIWQDRIVIDPSVLVGKPVVRGTRISVEFVVDLLGRGWSVEQILLDYDHLTREDIQACLAYAGPVLHGQGSGETPSVASRSAARPGANSFCGTSSWTFSFFMPCLVNQQN